jgi:hypothetical protein
MRQILISVVFCAVAATPGSAIEFLGVELCMDRVETGVILPAESPLSLESVEVGRHGGLVLLLHSEKGEVLGQVDDLMASFTGSRGTGDNRKLEWTSDEITAFAQVIKEGYVALAVSAAEGCTVEPATGPTSVAVESEPGAEIEATPEPERIEGTATVAAVAPVAEAEEAPVNEGSDTPADFELKGRLKHAAAEGDWVDVMGVVVNNSGVSYAVASFDLSLYHAAGDLICVDTISVNQLRDGQERAFRAAIRCADYVADEVESWKLQFAGGH